MKDDITAGELWAALGLAAAILVIVGLCSPARGQEGHFGADHELYHTDFYNNVLPAGCCHDADCRPTQSRTVGDHYEVMVNGEWMRVNDAKIVKIQAPDGGAHVCAPKSMEWDQNPDHIYCVVLPAEG